VKNNCKQQTEHNIEKLRKVLAARLIFDKTFAIFHIAVILIKIKINEF
jgi:hypothetical protein